MQSKHWCNSGHDQGQMKKSMPKRSDKRTKELIKGLK